jgi:hypothetical protein
VPGGGRGISARRSGDVHGMTPTVGMSRISGQNAVESPSTSGA